MCKLAMKDFQKLARAVSSFVCRNWFRLGIASRSQLSRLAAAALRFTLNCFPTKLSTRLRSSKQYGIIYSVFSCLITIEQTFYIKHLFLAVCISFTFVHNIQYMCWITLDINIT